MSNYEQKDNSGALFKNDKRETENHPHYKGSIRVDGKDYWVSSWINTAKQSGQTYMSLSVQPKDQQQSQPAPAKQDDGFEDQSIPF